MPAWLQQKDIWTLGELEHYLASEYGVTYESKQSYYDLFEAAGLSWKKTSKVNPKADAEAVAAKKPTSSGYWHGYQDEIERGQVRVLFIDERHLMAGDLEGYVWGKPPPRSRYSRVPRTGECGTTAEPMAYSLHSVCAQRPESEPD